MDTLAQRLLGGDTALAGQAAASLIVPVRDNFVQRPWGGAAMRRFKRCRELGPREGAGAGAAIGEAFEIAAYDGDAEAARFPSRVPLADGSSIALPELLARHGETLLGPGFVARYGACFPLLPKTLDIRELLSVQGHPAGHTEVYVIIDAEPAATIRLGFAADADAAALREELAQGLRRQKELLRHLAPGVGMNDVQALLKPWLADRGAGAAAVEAELGVWFAEPARRSAAVSLLGALKALYWRVLDALNAIPVAAGQVIHNATPARLLENGGREPAAEVHALGNPEGREILALEIRRPGPTFRAWDNVRFPVRDVDVDAALAVLNLRRTEPADFLVEPDPVPGRPGAFLCVDSRYFRVERLEPTAQAPVAVPAEAPHSLHVLAGDATVVAADGRVAGRLERGESALVPIGVGAYSVQTAGTAEIVRASLPPEA